MKPILRNGQYMMVDRVRAADVELPSPRPTPDHYWDGNKWEYDKTSLISGIKNKASNIITAKYPEWKQLNLQSDSSYATNAISGLVGIGGDNVMLRAVSLVGLTDDLTTLKGLEGNVAADDVDVIIADLTIDAQYMDAIKQYFVSIVDSIIAYRLIRLVRNWSNSKEQEINNAVDVSTIDLEDYPVI